MYCRFYLAVASFTLISSLLAQAQEYGPNLLPAGNFENVIPTYVPWAGVDASGNIHGLDGKQLAVNDSGVIGGIPFGPSIAVCDLNGDGKPDLVLGDTEGYFWFYPNSGTPQKPVFTQGEVIPIWLGKIRTGDSVEGVDNVVPRIQLIDLDGSKKFDILAGTYTGELFHIPNVGSSAQPNFQPTYHRDTLLINTHRRGVLWCNYFSPVMTTAFGSGNSWDMVMGDGTYSANSIYILHSASAGPSPSYDEDHIQKIIPGMGLEQLTPAIVDWNNDSKPDIVFGDRTGYIHLYLNNSSDPNNPTFAPAGNAPPAPDSDDKSRMVIGGVQNFGGSVTVAVGDLTGNHLPNLLIGKNDGTILYALNTGTLGNPQFTTTPTPIKGVLPPTFHHTALRAWNKWGAWGAPDEVVSAVNPQLEPGFTFPDGVTSKYAMKFSVWPVTNTYFHERYYPQVEDFWSEHVISCSQHFTLDLNKRYRIHFWVKSNQTVKEFRYMLFADNTNRIGFHAPHVIKPIDCGTSWTEFSDDIEISNPDDPTVTSWGFTLNFRFQGQSTFYVDDVQIQAEK